MSDGNSGYELAICFPDQSASFVHGFEAGRLYDRLKAAAACGAEIIGTADGFPIHAENEDLAIQMGRHFGYLAIIAPAVDNSHTDFSCWTSVRFEKIPENGN